MVSKKKKDETEEAVEATTETGAVEETAVEASADEAETTVEAASDETEAASDETEAPVEEAPAEVEAAPAEEAPEETVEAAPAEEAPKKAAAAKKPAKKEAAAKADAPAATETAKKGGKRAEKIGVVKSDKMTKTVVVRVDRLVKHPIYRKYVRKRKKFMAHDEMGAKIGDKVRIVETRPLSARKRWRVVEIIQKAEL